MFVLTKKMFISRISKDPPPPVTLSGIVETVTTLKLLGVYISNDLKWTQHMQVTLAKNASKLKQLKLAGVGVDELLCFHCSVIRPVLEYACPVWHSSLTVAQSKLLESVQKRAMKIIFPDIDYKSLIMARIDTLQERQEASYQLYLLSPLPNS